MKAGKTADQAAADYKVPEKYKGYTAAPSPQFSVTKQNLEILYNELKK